MNRIFFCVAYTFAKGHLYTYVVYGVFFLLLYARFTTETVYVRKHIRYTMLHTHISLSYTYIHLMLTEYALCVCVCTEERPGFKAAWCTKLFTMSSKWLYGAICTKLFFLTLHLFVCVCVCTKLCGGSAACGFLSRVHQICRWRCSHYAHVAAVLLCALWVSHII